MEVLQHRRHSLDSERFEVSTEIRLLSCDPSGSRTSPKSNQSTHSSTRRYASISLMAKVSSQLILYPQYVFLLGLGYLPTLRKGWRKSL